MWRYSMAQFADQALALRDELDLDEAVLGGTSLGANVALTAAVAAPERVRGMVVEMPVLELRVAPERLTGEIAAFLDECWKPRRARPRRRVAAASPASR